MGPVLSARQQHILRLLLAAKDPISITALGRETGISSKTAGNDVVAIGEYVRARGFFVNRKPGVGVWLSFPRGDGAGGSAAKWETLLADTFTGGPIPPMGSVLWTIFRTLAEPDWTTLEDLAEACYLSRTAVQQRLALLKARLAPFGLELESRRGKGLRLVGNEAAWRRVLHRYLLDPGFLSDREGAVDETASLKSLRQQFDLLMPGFPLDRVVDAVRQYEDERSRHFEDREFFYVVAFLGLAVARALRGHEGSPVVECLPPRGPAHALLMRVADEFGIQEAQFHLDQGLLERYLALMDGGAAVSDSVSNQLVDMAVARLEEFLGMPFGQDKLLVEALKLHVEAMRLMDWGLAEGEHRNPVLEEIKREYPQIYFGVREVAESFKGRTGRTLPPDEIGYLTMHFGASLVRNASRLECVYVSGASAAMATMNVTRLEREFPGMRVHSLPVHRAEREIQQGGIDLVIQSAAVKADFKVQVPLLTVQPWLTTDDLRRCHHLMNKILQSRFRHRLVVGSEDNDLARVLDDANWMFRLSPADPMQLIARLSESLVSRWNLPDDFPVRVMEREQLGWSSLAEGIAVPHVVALPNPSPGIALSLATLRHPVRWGDVLVDIVAVMAMHRESGNLFMRLFEWLVANGEALRAASSLVDLTPALVREDG